MGVISSKMMKDSMEDDVCNRIAVSAAPIDGFPAAGISSIGITKPK